MAYGNYGLVVDSKFKARSFDDLIKPLAMYTQEYNALEQSINELDTKASVWENMANEQTDEKAYSMYKNYANDLRDAADQLASQGLSQMSRPSLMNLKSRYSKEIVPIEQAFQNRAKEIEEQRAGRAKGMVYEGDASTASLDRYLNKPSIRYGMANAQEGFQRVATAATALSKKLREYGRGKALDGFTKTWLQEHGYRDNEINKAIADIDGALRGDGNVRGTDILTNILANEMQTAGVNNWNNAAKRDYYNRIAPALYQAVGQTQVGTYQDQAAILAAQEAAQIRAENRAIARENAKRAQVIGAETKPIDLFTVQKSEELKKFVDNKFLKKDPKTGQLKATAQSKAEYIKFVNKCKELGISVKQGQQLANMSSSQANEWIDNHIQGYGNRNSAKKAFGHIISGGDIYAKGKSGNLRLAGQYAAAIDEMYNASDNKSPLIKYGSGDNVTYGYQPGNIGNLFAQATGGRTTTISASTGWQYPITPAQSPQAINNLVSSLGTSSKKFKVVSYGNGNKFKQTNTFDKSALNEKDYDIINYVAHDGVESGVVAEVRGKGTKSSEHFFIEVPSTDANAKNIKKILRNQKVYTRIYNQDPASKNWANAVYQSGVSDIYSNMASMLRTNTSQAQTFQSAGTPLFGDIYGNSESQEEE